MADRGFTVKDMLETLGIGLNIPPFMEGRQQLPSEEIEAGRNHSEYMSKELLVGLKLTEY